MFLDIVDSSLNKKEGPRESSMDRANRLIAEMSAANQQQQGSTTSNPLWTSKR